jgi:hypothetical protein
LNQKSKMGKKRMKLLRLLCCCHVGTEKISRLMSWF